MEYDTKPGEGILGQVGSIIGQNSMPSHGATANRKIDLKDSINGMGFPALYD